MLNNGFTLETDEFTNNKKLVFVNSESIVLAITGATIGKTAINSTDQNIAISGDLLSIKSLQISPYYLLIVLNSPLIQVLFKKYITGTTNGHLSIEDISNLPIPIISEERIQNITTNVKLSIILKNQSKKLLEIAKIGVEKAIETDEETATQWINEQLEELGVKL